MNNKNSFQLAWHEVMELRLKKLAIVVMSGVQLLLPESLVGQVTELDPIDPESRLEMYDFEEAEAVWDHSVAFGLTLATGNSDVYLFNASYFADRRGTPNELSFGIDMNYGQQSGESTAESYNGYFQYNRLLTEDRYFGYMRGSFMRDAIAELDYRFGVGPGMGMYLIHDDESSLGVELGASYIIEKQGMFKGNYAAFRIGQTFQKQFNERVRLWQAIEILPEIGNFENFYAFFEIGVEAQFSDRISLRVRLQDVYDNTPSFERKSNDLRLITGLSYYF
jgi:putative salt-induced outer membrane protein YdiY